MAQRKGSGEAHPLTALAHAAEVLPAAGRRGLTRLLAGQVSFTTIVSNVPGPPVPLHLMGGRLLEAYPAVPILHGRSLTFGALTYDGTLHVGLYADAGVVEDRRRSPPTSRGAHHAVRGDRARPTPWQARARERRAAAAPPDQRLASR